MAPSRQKSCLACVQSKRKCDKGIPKCQRCVARKSDCEYNGRYLEQRPPNARGNADENYALAEPIIKSLAEPQMPSNWQLQSTSLFPDTTAILPWMSDAFFGLGTNQFSFGSISKDFSLDSTVINDMIARYNSYEIGHIIPEVNAQDRVGFVAKRLALIPKTFTEEGQTFFIHRALFQEKSPPALQDALSACALYSMKTTKNQALVFSNLEHKRLQLIANTDPLVVSRTNLLAAIQALILYQIIRLFDGDIRLRAQAEADESVLMMWATHLRLRTHQVPPSPLSLAETHSLPQNAFTDWHRWLIEESSRRTVITAFLLKGVYGFLKLGYDTVPDLRMSFTVQAALWNSQSETGWRRACSERERLELQVTHWDEVIGKAKSEDMEELGVLIMVMLEGVDATRKWLGERFISKFQLPESEYEGI
ncbi:hypothetical protein B0J11DRAFT_448147 [Dendryphion nanum]|uniref:Zn(2)-C6 fungal-type domain-containing protein n=1 Tax=Dendryphion nanum TaxID=256645 RepID=A0A9P9D0U0_9PLEO|nr:hypothetical protein B0J11DRAFT_448147 [Dendryphion nanum]